MSQARSFPSGIPDSAGVVWLSRPGIESDPCTADLTTLTIEADGSRRLGRPTPAADPEVDCFYVYPTTSPQQTINSDLTIDPEQRRAARAQASPFSTVGRMYAPMYRSLTAVAVLDLASVKPEHAKLAYDGVAAAFHDYMENYNAGRGIVFVGHSQGAWLLEALLVNEVDGDASLRRQLVSALLIGANIAVERGADAGGSFRNIPACRSADQAGSVIGYSTFTQPPTPDGWFGHLGGMTSPFLPKRPTAGREVLCVNPAELSGGLLDPLILTEEFAMQGLPEPPDTSIPWTAFPGQYKARCERAGERTWLQVEPADAADARPVLRQLYEPGYGLHNMDVSIAMGNLVRIVAAQAAAHAARK
jgi:hypothetical protein